MMFAGSSKNEITIHPYRVGWCTWKHKPWYERRWHRPWQAEAYNQQSPFARRALTAAGAVRKIARDEAVLQRTGRLSMYQRCRSWRKRVGLEFDIRVKS